jgi:hypothetical protein
MLMRMSQQCPKLIPVFWLCTGVLWDKNVDVLNELLFHEYKITFKKKKRISN